MTTRPLASIMETSRGEMQRPGTSPRSSDRLANMPMMDLALFAVSLFTVFAAAVLPGAVLLHQTHPTDIWADIEISLISGWGVGTALVVLGWLGAVDLSFLENASMHIVPTSMYEHPIQATMALYITDVWLGAALASLAQAVLISLLRLFTGANLPIGTGTGSPATR